MTNPESKDETTGEPTCASCGHLRLCHVCTASDCSCTGFVPWPEPHSTASSSPDEIPERVAAEIARARIISDAWKARPKWTPPEIIATVWLADAYERVVRERTTLLNALATVRDHLAMADTAPEVCLADAEWIEPMLLAASKARSNQEASNG